ncbi:ATP-binding protein [Chelatococcus sp. SYSU_G07232]|uniref:histidine kinase n=1 Tax=Chelatococcus albus TaxID=3047466 RepID=A0ABT7ABB3_9HYPH|nr:ATP-binding protein [Chelatococcus sp. SYSU_G07232]MDJ1156660.1 ATP-binding protein [Chelatococcus sp. SYSU_G07232]
MDVGSQEGRAALASAPGRAGRQVAHGPWLAFAASVVILLVGGVWLAGHVARERALAQVEARGRAAAALDVAVLRSELEKQRSLPAVLAADPDVIAALDTAEAAKIIALNPKLEHLSAGTRAAVIYLLDRHGMTVAASNWREPTSFVGNDYSFRPYFRRAMETGTGEHFALGTVSGRPGLYISRRVEGAGGALGVIVVKVEFDAVEEDWRRLGEPVYVTDRRNIVLVTSVPEWRFLTLTPIAPDAPAEIRASLQFGGAPLSRLPPRPAALAGREDAVEAVLPGARAPAGYLDLALPVPSTPWTLHLLGSTEPAVRGAMAAAQLGTALLVILAAGAAGIMLYRRQRAAATAAAALVARAELERQVAARTVELSAANERLVHEMEERRRAETELQTLQDELVQANKLALLGQIAAGVAHEINQPVATIRTYADNAALFLARGEAAPARDNLATIAGLTERIGRITDELRAFSRKATGRVGAASVAEAIDGALLLVGSRLRQQGVTLTREAMPAGLAVVAERVRLEQVLVNLLQNALDALVGRPDPRIGVAVEAGHESVHISVRDNGPGIASEVMAALFTPFRTTKPSGLGLGLVISHDIVAEFGGELVGRSEPGGGAVFTISLKRST